MSKGTRHILVLVCLLCAGTVGWGAKSPTPNPFLGYWALTLPDHGAGWLGVEEKEHKLTASILWGGGSVLPVNAVKVEGDKLIVTRVHPPLRGDPKTGSTETITATRDGDNLKLTTTTDRSDNSLSLPVSFTGRRIPPVPPKPDLAKVKFGTPITLFDGKSLDGWKLVNPADRNGWSVEDGILVNRPGQEPGQPEVRYGNLRTSAEFEDFKLTLEVNVGPHENSGVYLRGLYEVQICDSYVKGLDAHNMGAIYSRITPTMNAEKPPGTWQPMEMTLVDRHVTVLLNGQKIIDNQPLLGCTGGALTSDEFKPGPIYLQGDHTGIKYRKIVITPVVK